MADTKISALSAASTPLGGTEVLPIVQSSSTVNVSIANLTAGRSVSASSLTLTTTALSPASGGTGVANNAASTITISGNYASTFVVTGAYSYTLPPATDTLVNLGSTQTLTSKTLTNPTVTNYVETLYSANTSTSIAVALTNGTVQLLTLTANTTISMPSVGAGKSFIIMLKQDATGSRTVAW
ncbi:hypothetical protein UFOVP251_54 [uncultured Caudovirales phage]|uniref:Uncharacterized protein n=1 Tax=uncultured Caudovirales phage TaxID=2100421 RepID=A0A6J5LIU6_9CAUD|nr:hypothetical protein UFOVP251_54 [uncultured Caudovirales phage]